MDVPDDTFEATHSKLTAVRSVSNCGGDLAVQLKPKRRRPDACRPSLELGNALAVSEQAPVHVGEMQVCETSAGPPTEPGELGELLPHVEITPDTGGRRPPAVRKATVRVERMCGTGERDRVPPAASKQIAVSRPSQIDRQVGKRAVGVDDERRTVSEVGTQEQRPHLQGVLGEEQIVVREVANQGSARFFERRVSVSLAPAWRLGKVEESNARVREKRLECGSAVVLDTVADNEYLNCYAALGESAADGQRKKRRMTVSRNEDRRVGHGHPQHWIGTTSVGTRV
jgi:hypothetical protein